LLEESLCAGTVGACAAGDQPVESIEAGIDAAPGELPQDISAPAAGGRLRAGPSVAGASDCRIGAMVKQKCQHRKTVIAADRVVERARTPEGELVRVRAMLQRQLEPVGVVPVRLAAEQDDQALLVERAALEQQLHHRVVVRFRDVVSRFGVVGIGAVLQQEPGDLQTLRDCCRTVDRAFELQIVVAALDRLGPASVGIRADFEQGTSRLRELCGAGFLEAQIAGKAKMRQRIPAVRTTFGGGARGIGRKEAPNSGFVAQRGRGEDGCATDVRVGGKDSLRLIERA
jgi:hypothetical protein